MSMAMRCPICGAECRCKNRGPQGLCCPCHKHNVRSIRMTPSKETSPAMLESLYMHLSWLRDQNPTIEELPGFFAQ